MRAEELFDIYKRCAGRKQIEGIIDDCLDMMEAIKISIHGRLYFVPRTHMAQLNIFEDFIEALEQKKRRYEELLQKDLNELGSEFSTLRMFSQELKLKSGRLASMKECA